MTFMPVTVSANNSDDVSAATAGQPKSPCAAGCSISNAPRKPTRTADTRRGPTCSFSTNAASGTSHNVRVKESAFASASGIF